MTRAAFRLAAVVSAVVLGPAACARPAARTAPPPSASPSAVPTATIAPAAAAPSATPTAVATAAPVPTPPPSLPPPASPVPGSSPQILKVTVTPLVVHGGETVSAIVRTTPEVASVYAVAAGQRLAVPRVSVGEFAGKTVVPALPFFIHGTFPVTFVATSLAGETTQAAVTITIP